MIKNILLLAISGLFLVQTVKAQKEDSVLVYIKNHGELAEIVKTKDSADYSLKIMTPPDSSSGVKINRIKQYYLNNKLQLTGAAIIDVYKNYISLKLVGPCVNYYPNGHQESITNYKDGKQVGEIIRYYPNGNLYAIEKCRETGSLFLIECRDSTGKILSAKGNGNWLQFDKNFNKEELGSIKDSLKEGEWRGIVNDSERYLKIYHKGNFVPTIDTAGQIFPSADQDPGFYGGMKALYHFLGKNISYPAPSRENRIQGKVVLSFIIEKDGSITNIRVLSGPDSSLKRFSLAKHLKLIVRVNIIKEFQLRYLRLSCLSDLSSNAPM